MHPAMQERVDGLAALRERTTLATADFYSLIGRPAPKAKPRYQARSKGNMWHIIDTHTGKTCAFRSKHANAIRVLDGLEAAARCKLVWRQ